MQNVWLAEVQTGIKTAGRNINNLRYADNTSLMEKKTKKQKETREPLDEGERGE